jgi:hypothetical protein
MNYEKRKQEIFEMREKGFTFKEIAEKYNICVARAEQIYKQKIKDDERNAQSLGLKARYRNLLTRNMKNYEWRKKYTKEDFEKAIENGEICNRYIGSKTLDYLSVYFQRVIVIDGDVLRFAK